MSGSDKSLFKSIYNEAEKFEIEEIIKDGFKISVKINIVPKKDDGFNTSMSIGKGIIEFSKTK